mgnify:CR=1 FL=1
MKERKTRALVCIITGRRLLATKDYYNRKIEKCGSEEELHRTYVCKEAKSLLKRGYNVDSIRDLLNVDKKTLHNVPQDIVDKALNSKSYIRRINNFSTHNSIINPKTDPDVRKFIDNITKNE